MTLCPDIMEELKHSGICVLQHAVLSIDSLFSLSLMAGYIPSYEYSRCEYKRLFMIQVVVVYSRSSSDVSGVGGWKEMALIVFASFTATMMVSSHAMLSSIVVKRM